MSGVHRHTSQPHQIPREIFSHTLVPTLENIGIMTNSLDVRIPPRQSTAKKSASSKLDLARDSAVANVDYIFHLLKPLTLGWHLEEIHVTWAHLEKKRTRLRTCTKIHHEVLFSERGDGIAGIKRRRCDLSGDGVWLLVMASQRSRLKVDLEQSACSRVPIPLPEDPYEAIRQAYLVGMDTKSEPFEDPVETKAPELPHTIASPTSLPDSTPPTCHVKESEGSDTSGARSTSSDSTAPLSPDHPLTHTTPTLVPILSRTVRMAVRVPPEMSSYESSPSSSPPDLPLRKRYRGTSELVEDDDEEGDDKEEDEDIEESLDSDSVSKDAEDEASVVKTAMGEPLRLGYGALGRREIALGEVQMPSVFEVGQSSGFVLSYEFNPYTT
ncbi:hypothetical protein Tco_0092089 [Tanacetum coccineum]